jgi:O-antigen ligase
MVFSFGFVIFCLTEVALQHEMIGTYYAYMLVLLYVMSWKFEQDCRASWHRHS